MNTSAVMGLTGASERQLTYWCRIGLLRPEQSWPGGPGTRRVWSWADALQAWAVLELSLASTAGSRKAAQHAVEALRERVGGGDTVCIVWDSGAVCGVAEDVPSFLDRGPLRVLIFPVWARRGQVAA